MMESKYGAAAIAALVVLAGSAHGQLLINEFNAVSADNFVEDDEAGGTDKPYEGFDYGVFPHSGNLAAPPAGNPFPMDVDAGAAGNQTTLPNGWDGSTGFARVEGNGGDWLELVVTQDHLDLRGWSIYWENDETDRKGDPATLGNDPGDGAIGSHPAERGFLKFTQNAAWSDLRAGTIITISESVNVDEVRDQFDPGVSFPGPPTNDTGFNYSLATDLSFDPAAGDWHIHFHLNEAFTDSGLPTDYFEAYSDIKVDNDRWRAAIFDASNDTIAQWTERVLPGDTDADGDVDASDLGKVSANFNTAVANRELDGDLNADGFVDMDDLDIALANYGQTGLGLTTGLIGTIIGESLSTWGDNTGAGGVSNGELGVYRGELALGQAAINEDYEDVDFSTFGMPNLYNVLTEATLDGFQDFSALRAWFAPEAVAALPEPGTIGLLVLGSMGLARRRR